MACRGSFSSYHEENDPDQKSGRNLDPDKLGCAMTSWRDVTDFAFLLLLSLIQ